MRRLGARRRERLRISNWCLARTDSARTHTAGSNDPDKRGDGMDEEDDHIAHASSYQLTNCVNFNVFWISPGTGTIGKTNAGFHSCRFRNDGKKVMECPLPGVRIPIVRAHRNLNTEDFRTETETMEGLKAHLGESGLRGHHNSNWLYPLAIDRQWLYCITL